MLPDYVRIFHIKEEIDFLMETYRGLDYEDFIGNRTLKLSAQKSLEIIGEAANQISSDLKEKYPDIPWIVITGLRNRLTHKYFDVSWPIVWEIIQSDIPQLDKQIRKIIEIESL